MSNKPIGGYFELELPTYPEFHKEAIALNSGRFCLEYILRCRDYSKVYVPYFTCDSAIEPIVKLGIPYEFYHIDWDCRIIDSIELKPSEALLYTNYWGLYGDYCLNLAQQYGAQLILDYTQSFFEQPIDGVDTFYSCRKFFGVPDGGYLYTDCKSKFDIEQDLSYTRMDSLIKRIDIGPEAGYADFRACSETFHHMPIRFMSQFTKRMMNSIDYNQVRNARRANYKALYSTLGGAQLGECEVPMIFPYRVSEGTDLRNCLIRNKIFVAKYWPNVESWAGPDSFEAEMANNILPLPIDQRYTLEDMKYILKIIKCYE